ncbi:hypothetical protein HS961_11270 [Comamonas piscis]|uniref:Uncharacterized protein n=1 Tax=Comamonas piscis TaxID=1562974 RepID=A0A7G5EH89_9BURK|nr:hypothetical protein [Comamonas piscis]QMV73364.1 hypothetical protein HS961_11270 [Comamonas piscis]WSO36167.1 hypothetical protein VUJ63_11305 [Comamonas piscis]
MRKAEDLLVVTQAQYERLELEVVGLRDLEALFGSPQHDRLQDVELALIHYQPQFRP